MSAAAPAAPTPAAGSADATLRGFHWPPSFAMAWVTFLEFWRRWFLLGLLVIGLMPGLLATFMPVAVQHPSERVELIILWGLGGVAFGGALGASLMASLQTPMEIEDRRIYGLVCRPIGRWRILIGKMLGCALFLTIYAAITYVALVAMTRYALAGQPDAAKYAGTRSSQDAIFLGMDVQPKHVVPYTGQSRVELNFDFTTQGPIPTWGKTAKDRYRWVLLTVVRTEQGQPVVSHRWDDSRPAFQFQVNGGALPQVVIDQDKPAPPRMDWYLEPSGHVLLIIPESYAAARPADRVQLTLTPVAGYFQPGDEFFFSDIAVYDTFKPPYDENRQQMIPFAKTFVTVGPGQSADYLLARDLREPAVDASQLSVGLLLKSAVIFRDIFALQVQIDRFAPDQPAFQTERQAHWVVTERKMFWTPLAHNPAAGSSPAAPVERESAGGDLDFGPVEKPGLTGWSVLRLKGLPQVMGVRDSGAMFQIETEGNVRFAAVRSTLEMNLFVAVGLFFIQWLCLVMIVGAWSGNLSLGVAVLCALILAVSCYGSGSARSVLTDELRTMEYRERMHEIHPELKAPPVEAWQFALNHVMSGIIWTPPDFMQYSPTEPVKEQVDIPFREWAMAALYLLVFRALPVSVVGLLVFQRREF